MLTDYPVRYTSPEVREALRILESVYYTQPSIVALAQTVGLPLGQIDFNGRLSLVWRSVFDTAAGQGRVDALLDEVTAEHPALQVRLEELRAARPVTATEAPIPAAQRDFQSPGWKNFSADGQSEAIVVAGQPTFVDVAFLAKGVQRAGSICRMVTRFPAGDGSGTGFRVGKRHLLTNYHVLFDDKHGDAKVTSVEAWFNYEADVDGNPKKLTQVPCDPSSIIGEKKDDWALVAVSQPIPDDFPVLVIGGVQIPDVDDRVYIIQHPGGGPKQVAFQHNLVRAVMPDILQYWTDTDLGSSGSPVFDKNWDVVGLHHFSVKAPAADKVGVRNQGRRIDTIVERIRAVDALPELRP